MTFWAAEDLSQDAFLGGRIHLWQPHKGYRVGIDAVLLAASVPAQAGDRVLDLGCGVGAAALCLAARVPGLHLVGLERHSGYASLATGNGQEAGQEFTVLEGDVGAPPAELKAQRFDFVLANPPYYDRTRGSSAPDSAREAALGEDVALRDWTECAARRLKPKGYLHMILKADRLADGLNTFAERLGSIEIQPLAPREGRAAELVILRARKGGRGALRLHAPILLHQGSVHPGDHDHYTDAIADVLRRGAALRFSSPR